MSKSLTPIDLAALRQKLAGGQGVAFWRSLEELADTPAFQDFMQREFPRYATEWPQGLRRRDFLSLLGASLGLAGLAGCTKQPVEKIAPYVRQPEQLTAGTPLFFATAMAVSGVATGVLVESHQGRPTKIEGNPDHPASLGATDLMGQASVLGLYDPDRSQVVQRGKEVSSWPEFLNAAQVLLTAQRRTRGAGLRLLTDTVSSPTLSSQIRALLADLPAARWHQWEPVNRDAPLLGARLAFGTDVETLYHFDNADRVLSIDADFLTCGPGNLRYTRDFTRRRRPESGAPVRLYVIETTPTATGEVADHRLPLRPSQVEGFLRALAGELGAGPMMPPEPTAPQAAFIAAVGRDLRAHPGTSLVLAGDSQPPIIHALAHAMNQTLRSVGSTVSYHVPVAAQPVPQLDSLRDLAAELNAGLVDTLIICDVGGGSNPVYTAPAELRFAELLGRARLRLHLGPYFDETAALCHWHVPAAHYLESWSDTRAYDGTASIVQPLIAPLYEGRTAHELLAALTDTPQRSSYELVRSFWRSFWATAGAGPDFELRWRQALDRGVIPDTAQPTRPVTLRPLPAATPGSPAADPGPPGLELVFRPDQAIYDGRFANNGWLQELPRSLTRLTWENVALLSPRTAERLGVSHWEGWRGKELHTEVIELQRSGRLVRAPIWIQPGQPDDCITLTLGYGRSRAGRVGNGIGYNAYLLRTSDAQWSGRGVVLRKTGQRRVLASTQLHFSLAGRNLIPSATFAEYQKEPHFAHHEEAEEEKQSPLPRRLLNLYPEYPYPGHAWGMAIDLSACVGCSACVVACQAENNIPVVGKDQVARGRHMNWLRIDHYYKGNLDNPTGYFQPIPCMHCEKAPCEPVCPVAATVHNAEGLNDMVYNRCVGTRYCQNNCPYKVRRFNFLNYTDDHEPGLLQRNPEVTVRSRGVMEKCTYCVQRITQGRIRAELDGRRVRDGEIRTACQAACPAEAIVFGDINDPDSRVSQLKALPRDYELLGELNTRPRTTYQAAVRNPNPELKGV